MKRLTNKTVIGLHPKCGGAIQIADHGTTRGEFRYEAYCARCLQSDPNGYATLKETAEKAAKYFGIK